MEQRERRISELVEEKERAARDLIRRALQARKRAYAPYSGHKVGAALMCTDGTVFTGCNVENAAFSPTNCAERTAIFKAVSEGYTDFARIAVVGGPESASNLSYCAPCGVCRQVMMEFVNADTFEIVLAKVQHADRIGEFAEEDISVEILKLRDLLPFGFGPENL